MCGMGVSDLENGLPILDSRIVKLDIESVKLEFVLGYLET